jgi:hypothetical protein
MRQTFITVEYARFKILLWLLPALPPHFLPVFPTSPAPRWVGPSGASPGKEAEHLFSIKIMFKDTGSSIFLKNGAENTAYAICIKHHSLYLLQGIQIFRLRSCITNFFLKSSVKVKSIERTIVQ